VSTWALVPVKARSAGKQRLAGVLSEPQRTALIGAMLEHVLAVVRAAPLAGVLILSPDREPLPPTTHVLRDRATGLNAALELALPELLALQATRALIVFADLPLLSCEDLVALERASEAFGVALAPDHTGTGTNALGLTLPTAFRLQFGAGSCARHQLEAERIGRSAALVRRPGFAFDVDEPSDLEPLRARADPRYAFLG
jgi:2-phospho-L-lactate/phosphoenolpyruvate guanylyltransferase